MGTKPVLPDQARLKGGQETGGQVAPPASAASTRAQLRGWRRRGPPHTSQDFPTGSLNAFIFLPSLPLDKGLARIWGSSKRGFSPQIQGVLSKNPSSPAGAVPGGAHPAAACSGARLSANKCRRDAGGGTRTARKTDREGRREGKGPGELPGISAAPAAAGGHHLGAAPSPGRCRQRWFRGGAGLGTARLGLARLSTARLG